MALSDMEQEQKNTSKKPGHASAWAWSVSIALHVILLAIFAIVKFSSLEDSTVKNPAPIATIKQISQLTETSPTIPKPKVRKLPSARPKQIPLDFTKRTKVAPPKRLRNIPAISTRSAPLPDTDLTFARIEFFGQLTDQRKICYVVDCSASMLGLFSNVRNKLKESISKLRPDQYFYIILFRGDKLLESGNGKLTRATPNAKKNVYEFIDAAQPAGPNNAFNALKRAMHIKDRAKTSPAQIYFLTDGFDLNQNNATGFSELIENMRKKLAPATRINTIGFWAADADCRVLRNIARHSGGEFINVR